MRMTLRERDEWIEALLSGKYKQGKGALHEISNGKSSFCCLGILCDLHKQRLSLTIDYVPNLKNGKTCFVKYDSDQSLLPPRLSSYLEEWTISTYSWSMKCLPKWKQWYIRIFKDPYISGDLKASLVDMNDGIGLSFKDIAKVIKHNVIIKEEPVT